MNVTTLLDNVHLMFAIYFRMYVVVKLDITIGLLKEFIRRDVLALIERQSRT